MAELIRVDAGDLVATASADVTLEALTAALAEHGAWVALDPAGPATMTLGECLAAGAGGPLSAGFGLPRDQVLGLSFTASSGAEVKSGGRVVKNVAGFDLAKLLIGSHGRFGRITEAHLRLRVKPEADRTVVYASDTMPEVTRRLMLRGVNPVCFEVFDPQLAEQLGLKPRWTLALRAMGSSVAVEEEIEAWGLKAEQNDASLWTRWREITGAWPLMIRIGADPSTWHEALALAGDHAGASITVPRGTVRVAPRGAVTRSLRWPIAHERGGDPWGDLPAGIAGLVERLSGSWAAAATA